MADRYQQNGCQLSITTPFGDDALLLQAFSGIEAMSEPFAFDLDLISEKPDLAFDSILGKGSCVTITRAAGQSPRNIHGLVTRFEYLGTDARFSRYRAQLRPWFWLLHHAASHQIFQGKTVPQILEAIFSDLGYSDYKMQLTATYEAREYCVQYGETFFDFASRLMEEEGIFYFFEHSNSAHTLVLADDSSAHADCLGANDLVFRGEPSTMPAATDLLECRLEGRVTSAKYQSDDFNFEMPQTDLLVADGSGLEPATIYEYPGRFAKKDDGQTYARIRLEALEQPQLRLVGRAAAYGLTSGSKFTLSEHPRSDANGDYVLCRVEHAAAQNTYENFFDACPLATAFRPAQITHKPRIAGTQTALVVGKQGEEIWTDKYGRIKVKFHWDQSSSQNENASCWVRVSQPAAGKQWGAIQVPRIGQEVVVSFLEGDPDRPLVTGRVYNADQMPPYTLPDNATQWGFKSNSSKGGDGFNELRFEDKAGSEEVYMHAQKDLNVEVENNQAVTVQQNRTTTVAQGDETQTVSEGNRTVSVDTGNETKTVAGTRSLTTTGDETHTNEANFTQEVTGDFVLKVTGNLTIEATGAISFKSAEDVSCEAAGSMSLKAGTSLTSEAGASLMNKAAGALTNRAGGALIHAAGGVQTIGAAGMLVMGSSMVMIQPFNPT